MIGLRTMQHEDRRDFLRLARASRIAQATAEDYRRTMREEAVLAGLA